MKGSCMFLLFLTWRDCLKLAVVSFISVSFINNQYSRLQPMILYDYNNDLNSRGIISATNIYNRFTVYFGGLNLTAVMFKNKTITCSAAIANL